jgi:hypothetical protein
MTIKTERFAGLFMFIFSACMGAKLQAAEPTLMPIGEAWAQDSVNVTVFRNDPITTFGDQQYAAYYNAEGHVVIAHRKLADSKWTTTVTDLTGNIKDAHNVISIIADGEGYLHISWDHHDNPLRYARSKAPGSLEFETPAMTGKTEAKVTYPQFFKLANGDLIFMYRDGASGRGNLVLNHYDTKNKSWTQMYDNLISGEGKRNAYWEACVDGKGSIHIAWVWRESGDVASNHDVLYARSDDGGHTWVKSQDRRGRGQHSAAAGTDQSNLHVYGYRWPARHRNLLPPGRGEDRSILRNPS